MNNKWYDSDFIYVIGPVLLLLAFFLGIGGAMYLQQIGKAAVIKAEAEAILIKSRVEKVAP